MQYKSIVLELLRQQPIMYTQLRLQRSLLMTVNDQARRLRDRHQQWQEALTDLQPELGPEQLRALACEIALAEFEACLASGSVPIADEPISLEEVLDRLRADSLSE